MERLVPETMICDGRMAAVERVIAHPPNRHPGSPIRDDLTAVECVTGRGSRWFGTERAWIGPDLRMHMLVNERDEVRRNWEQPS